MPKATLNKPVDCDYTFVRGASRIKFIGGQPQDVSVSVALSLKKKTENGKPLFDICDFPELLASEPEQGKTNEIPVKQSFLF